MLKRFGITNYNCYVMMMERDGERIDGGYFVRKLQKIKNGSYIITLPSNWIKDNNLKVHDDIAIIYNRKYLIIKPIKRDSNVSMEEINKVKVNIENYDTDTLLYAILMYYLQGVDTLELFSNNIIKADVKRRLRNFLSNLINADIQEISSNDMVITINDFLKLRALSREEFNEIIYKMIALIGQALDDLRVAIMNNNLDLIEEIHERIKDMRRRYYFTIRLLAKMSQYPEYSVLSTREIVIYAEIARDLYQLSRHILNATNYLQNIKLLNAANTMHIILLMLNNIGEMYKYIINSVDKFDATFINKSREIMNNIRNTERETLQNMSQCINREDLSVNIKMNIIYLIREIRYIAGYCIALLDDYAQLNMSPIVM